MVGKNCNLFDFFNLYFTRNAGRFIEALKPFFPKEIDQKDYINI